MLKNCLHTVRYLLIILASVAITQCKTIKQVSKETQDSPQITTASEKSAEESNRSEAVMKADQVVELIPGTPVSFEMTLIPGGKFKMGVAEEIAGREDESPVVEMTVDSFWMGVHEVTFEEYNVFREKDLDLPPGDDKSWDADAISRPSPPYEDPTFGMGEEGYPAVSMTQFGALQYCKWLSDKTGEFYRLPTEAEWEYACKAGMTSGPDPDQLDRFAWSIENSSEKYHLVGEKEANPWGLHDILGNVSEWTLDQYTPDAYEKLSANPDLGWIRPTRLHPRTVRGGSWDDDTEELRCSSRIPSSYKWKERDPQIPKSFWWNTDSPFVGFRLVKPYRPPSAEEQEEFWILVLGG